MAFGNFWRGGGRERFGSERDDQERNRDRERWRTTGSDWRDDERDRWRDNESRENRYGGERLWQRRLWWRQARLRRRTLSQPKPERGLRLRVGTRLGQRGTR